MCVLSMWCPSLSLKSSLSGIVPNVLRRVCWRRFLSRFPPFQRGLASPRGVFINIVKRCFCLHSSDRCLPILDAPNRLLCSSVKCLPFAHDGFPLSAALCFLFVSSERCFPLSFKQGFPFRAALIFARVSSEYECAFLGFFFP